MKTFYFISILTCLFFFACKPADTKVNLTDNPINIGNCYVPGKIILLANNKNNVDTKQNHDFGLIKVGYDDDKLGDQWLLPYRNAQAQVATFPINTEVMIKIAEVGDGMMKGMKYASEIKILDKLKICPNYLDIKAYPFNIHSAFDHYHKPGGPDHVAGHIINVIGDVKDQCYNGQKTKFIKVKTDLASPHDKVYIPDFRQFNTSYQKIYFEKSIHSINGVPVMKSMTYFHDHWYHREQDLKTWPCP